MLIVQGTDEDEVRDLITNFNKMSNLNICPSSSFSCVLPVNIEQVRVSLIRIVLD